MADELLDIVDDQDRVIGKELRSMAHARGSQHRGVHLFLFRQDGKLLVQKRSPDRTASPSALDCSVSEHVKAGESYLEAAMRGMKEEMGLDGIPVDPLVTFKMKYGPGDNEISTLFRGIVDPALVKFDPLEVEQIGYYDLEELGGMIRGGRHEFCSWFVQILNWYTGGSAELTVLKTY